jgi:hypothetical protein
MKAFDPNTLGKWLEGQRAAGRRGRNALPPADAIRLSLSLIEAAWSVAENEPSRRAHEDDAKPVREMWKLLARRTGKLP